ncbi:sulfurtransferase [Lysobacter sp. GCM10012299]|uniref:sulfurtransferase n=1 Tax=Lysobacter sp. GCM10012299 TaxID=3317333 RepID=UPI003610CA26
MTSWTTLISAEELASALGRDDVVVVDARSKLGDPATAEAAYRQAHIPGARYAHLERDLSAPEGTAPAMQIDAGRHPWPQLDDFLAVLGRWGITPQTQVVAYDAGDGALAAARLWFLLRMLGHERVAVLDGGWEQWQAQGLPVDTEVPEPMQTRYTGSFDESRLLDAAQVQAHLDSGGLLFDARAAERFRGDIEPIDRVAGHVPGARNRPYASSMRDGRFRPATDLAAELTAQLDGHPASDAVVMCGSGVTACHLLLAMEHAGLKGARLFKGSWSGWIADPNRPVAKGD